MAATMVCAVGGALAAGSKRMDLVGLVFVAFVAAVGGGSVRDLLLDRNPVFWIAQPSYLAVSLGSAVFTWLTMMHWRVPGKALDIVDAFGLALFTISGIQVAQDLEQSLLICLVMGVVTGVVGGVLRDVLCGEIPRLFQGGELYASASLAGGAVYFATELFRWAPQFAAVSGAAVVVLLRLGALLRGWKLPLVKIKTPHQ